MASANQPANGSAVTLTALVRNLGMQALAPTATVTVNFYSGNALGAFTQIAERVVSGPLQFGDALSATAVFTATGAQVIISATVFSPADLNGANNGQAILLGVLNPPIGLHSAHEIASLPRLAWQAPEGLPPKGYRLYRRDVSFGGFGLIGVTLTSTMFTDTGAQRGATYAYAASAADENGNESPMSEPLTVTVPLLRPVFIPIAKSN